MPQTYYVGARSNFVTVIAWAFILLAALASLSGLVQQASLASWTPALNATVQSQPLPLLSGWLLDWLPYLVATGLVLSFALMIASIGTLLRYEWARQTFIALLGLMIIANLAGLWLQHAVVQSLVDATLRTSPLPPGAADVFGGFVTAARVMAGIVTLSACGALALIIRRLMTPAVRQEFA